MKRIKLLIAVALLAFAFQDNIKDLIPDNLIPDIIKPIVVEISKPSDEFIAFSKDFVSEITSEQELSELAVLNDEYSSRLTSYKSPSVLEVNSVYVKTVGEVFANKYMGKYPIYKNGVISIVKEVAGEKDRSMSPEDLVRLSGLFRGLSWNLAQKLASK